MDIIKMITVPKRWTVETGAKAYYVDPAKGSDSNSGLSVAAALATVGKAYTKCVDKQGDVIYLINDGNTSGSSREASLPITWAKDNTHLVGICAPAMLSQRSRITPVSTAALTANAVIDVTGSGNIFTNVQIAHYGANTNGIAARGVDVSGSRNYFKNVHMVGIPNAHTGDEANACDLLLDGGSENVFEDCVIGVDTVACSTTNANIELTTAAARNVFKNCVLPKFADNNGALFVKVDGAADVDRFTIFDGCLFVNAVASTGTTMTGATDVHAAAGGMLVMKNCMLIGATDWEAADTTNIWILGAGVDGTAKEIGIGTTVDVA